MDIRIMQNYLAVVREGTISGAASTLHMAQPALSRQMKDLERELGTTLFVRGNRKITLTEEGMVLRRRAEEMVQLMQMTREELSQMQGAVSGTVRIGAGESRTFHYLSRVAAELSAEYPDVRFQVTSGDTQDLMYQLSGGLIDFAVIFTDADEALYEGLALPTTDVFGVLMRRDDPLAAKETVSFADLAERPVIISRASEGYLRASGALAGLRIAAVYNLIFNASLMVEDGLGVALCFDGLVNVSGDSPLAFRPLSPGLAVTGSLIWKKYQVLSPAVQVFLARLREEIGC